MMKKAWLAVGLAAAWLTSLPLAALDLGAVAPELNVSEWVKGEPVSLKAEQGKGYVVLEFYASDDIMSRPAMMHLNNCVESFKNDPVKVVCVSVEEPETVRNSVLFPYIRYNVATDDGQFAKTYLEGREDQLPVTFIINPEGQVIWIGSPLNVQEPLREMLDGKYDFAKILDDNKLRERMYECLKANNMLDALKTVNQLLEQNPNDDELIAIKVRIIFENAAGNPDESIAWLDEMLQKRPDMSELYLLKLRMLGVKRDFASQDKVYEEFIKRFADRPELLMREGEGLLKRRSDEIRLLAAVRMLEQAWKSPKLDEPIAKAKLAQLLARAYGFAGCFKQAQAMQLEAIKIQESMQGDTTNLVRVLRYYEESALAQQQILQGATR